MPLHPFEPPRGRVERFAVESDALRDNLIGDPAVRHVSVYLPPGYDRDSEQLPLLVALAGFTGSGLKMLGWRAFEESLPQRIDRLTAAGEMGPAVVALPDCFTSLGGNQYVNSAALGRWEDWLLDDALPQLEQRYRVRSGSVHRAVFGKSSGGYGALIHALRHGDRWGAVAAHSPDVGFDLVYLRDMPKALDALARHDGDPSAFVRHLREAPEVSGDDFYALMLLAMAATYDPDPEAPFGVRLPVTPDTCELIDERWAAWLAHDPLTIVEDPAAQTRLRGLRLLFVDCGNRDQYALHYGTRRLARRLGELGVEHRHEEFDGTHSGIDHRLDVSLPALYRAIAG